MVVHLGQDYVVNTDDILGIFDLDTATACKASRNFLQRCDKEGTVISVSEDLPRSFIVRDFPHETVYLSTMSTATLAERCRRFIV